MREKTAIDEYTSQLSQFLAYVGNGYPMRMSARSLLLIICLLAASVRFAVFIHLDRFRHPELWENETIATNLLEGRGFVFETLGTQYRSYMEPLYPALCALVYRVTDHSFLAMGVVHVALGTALVALVFVCGRRVIPEPAALVAALLTALHPGLIVYTTKFHPFVLDAVLWWTAFTIVLAWSAERPWRSACVGGLIIGLSVLTRPTILACVPMLGWWIWQRSNSRLLHAAGQLAVLLACAAVVVAPWAWRNYEIHRRFMLTRSGTSFVFWLGNNPYLFTGSSMTPDGGPIIDRVPDAVRDRLRRVDEVGQQDYFRQEASQFIASHPGEFLERSALKLGYFWWFSPQSGLLYPQAWLRIFKIFYLAIVVLAAAGVWTCWRARTAAPNAWLAALFLLGCAFSISLLQSVYYVEGRHRLAIEPVLLIFAGGGIYELVRRQLVLAGRRPDITLGRS